MYFKLLETKDHITSITNFYYIREEDTLHVNIRGGGLINSLPLDYVSTFTRFDEEDGVDYKMVEIEKEHFEHFLNMTLKKLNILK